MEEIIAFIFWLGQSCFVIQAPEATVLLDPYNARMGYETKTVEGVDLVTVSHEHGDHNAIEMAAGEPLVLRGLAEGGKAFNPIDQTVEGIHIRTVASYHDAQEGGQRGRNAIFIFDLKRGERTVRIVHMGDFGQERLTDEQIKAIGQPDVLMLPVGGHYTIGPEQANQVLVDLKPLVVVPMHWKTRATERLPIGGLEPFLEGKKNVLRSGGTSANRLVLAPSLLKRAEEADEPLIVALDFGPPPEPRLKPLEQKAR